MSAAPWALASASGVGLPRVSTLARSSSRRPEMKAPSSVVGRNAGRNSGSRRLVSPRAIAGGDSAAAAAASDELVDYVEAFTRETVST